MNDYRWLHVKSKADDIEVKYTALLNYFECCISFYEVDTVRDIHLWNQFLEIEKEIRLFGTLEALEYAEAFAKRIESYRKRFFIRKFQRLYMFMEFD